MRGNIPPHQLIRFNTLLRLSFISAIYHILFRYKNMNLVRILLLSTAIMLAGTGADAQKKERAWSLQAGFGQVTLVENKGTGDKYWAPEDIGNSFYLTADYQCAQPESSAGRTSGGHTRSLCRQYGQTDLRSADARIEHGTPGWA